MIMEWENSFTDFSRGPSQQYNVPVQREAQRPDPQQLMPNVYQPTIPQQQQEEEFYYEEPTINYKQYIALFVLILIVYFILSLDPVKNAIGQVLTCINLREDGTISKVGYFVYGILLSLIVVGTKYLMDNYISFNF